MSKLAHLWQSIGKLDDIPVRGSRRVQHGDKVIALFRTADNAVYALADSCPHEKGPLSAGIVHDGCVTCPLHNWVISLQTGEAQGADKGSTTVYPVKVDGDDVLIAFGSAGIVLTEPSPAVDTLKSSAQA